MIREVCLFDKFSFCKNGVKCTRVHLKEICQNRDCDYRRCDKRHPRPCRIFRMHGFCRFGTSCRYSHRLPKEIEELNNKIKSLEKLTAELSRLVADQNNEIKDLKSRLLEIESNELKKLKNQIDDLVKNNNEKVKAIKELNEDLSDNDKVSEEVEEEVENLEAKLNKNENVCLAEKVQTSTIKFVRKVRVYLTLMEGDVKEAGIKTWREHYQARCGQIDSWKQGLEGLGEILCPKTILELTLLEDFLSQPVTNNDREKALMQIKKCNKNLTDYSKEPCKKCLS